MHQHEQDLIAERDRLQKDEFSMREHILDNAHDYYETKFYLDCIDADSLKLNSITNDADRDKLVTEISSRREHIIEHNNEDSLQTRVYLDEIGEDVTRIRDIDKELVRESAFHFAEDVCKADFEGCTKGHHVSEISKEHRDYEKHAHDFDKQITCDRQEGKLDITDEQQREAVKLCVDTIKTHDAEMKQIGCDINEGDLRKNTFAIDTDKPIVEIKKDLQTQVQNMSIDREHGLSR